jgi:hypothetical protein
MEKLKRAELNRTKLATSQVSSRAMSILYNRSYRLASTIFLQPNTTIHACLYNKYLLFFNI